MVVVSPPPSAGDDSGVGLVGGVGETLGETFGDGLKLGPAGTTCWGATLAFIGSNERLVIKSARKVASAAATMRLTATESSA